MPLAQLLHELKETKDWAELQRLSKEISGFGDEAVAPLIEIWSQFPRVEDYHFDFPYNGNLHSIVEDTLVTIGDGAVDALIPLLNSDKWGERFGAIYCLHHIGNPRAIEPMITSLSTGDSNVVGEIAEAMESFGTVTIAPLLEALKDSNPKLRSAVAHCLRRFRQAEVKTALSTLALSDSVADVRLSALASLSRFEDESVTQVLQQILEDENQDIRELAQDYLDERSNEG